MHSADTYVNLQNVAFRGYRKYVPPVAGPSETPFFELGQALKAARARKGLRQREIAKVTGMSLRQVALVEAGANVSLSYIEKLVDLLQVRELPLGRAVVRVRRGDAQQLREAALAASRLAGDLADFMLSMKFDEARDQDDVIVASVPSANFGRERLARAAHTETARDLIRDAYMELAGASSNEPLADIFAIPDGPFRKPSRRVVDDDWIDVTVEGRVAAGPPIDYESHEVIKVPRDQAPDPGWKVLEAWGDSMIEFEIDSGDLVYVEPRVGGVAATGDIVIGWLNDGLVIKEWEQRRKRRRLISKNAAIEPLELGANDYWQLRAIVRKVLKRRPRAIDFTKANRRNT